MLMHKVKMVRKENQEAFNKNCKIRANMNNEHDMELKKKKKKKKTLENRQRTGTAKSLKHQIQLITERQKLETDI